MGPKNTLSTTAGPCTRIIVERPSNEVHPEKLKSSQSRRRKWSTVSDENRDSG